MKYQAEIKNGLVWSLVNYIEEREASQNYTGSRLGYSKTDKVTAARALIEVLNSTEATRNQTIQQLIPIINPLKQGTLKLIWNYFSVAMPDTYKAIKTAEETYVRDSKREQSVSMFNFFFSNNTYDGSTDDERMRGRYSCD